MLRVLSTHLFLNQRLHPGLLELAERSGVEAVEIFAARQHFDYTSREHVRELCEWFRSNSLQVFSLHAPLWPDREMGRAGAPAVNVIHPEKARRIDAMDEIKRALESAEFIPFRNMVVHLGERDDGWSQRTMEFAEDRAGTSGRICASPGCACSGGESAQRTHHSRAPGHDPRAWGTSTAWVSASTLDTRTFQLASLKPSIVLSNRIVSLHVHDNHGTKDEHLWPGDGNIAWPAVSEALKALKTPPAAVLEISQNLGEAPAAIAGRVQNAFEKLA